MNVRNLKKKLNTYIKFKDLAKSIKMIALSQLKNFNLKLQSRTIALSVAIPFFTTTDNEFKSVLLLPIGVDKTCCGPHNSNITKALKDLIVKLIDRKKLISIFALSRKVKEFVKRNYIKYLKVYILNYDKEPISFLTASLLYEKILEYTENTLYFIFNRYYTPLDQRVVYYKLNTMKHFSNFIYKSLNELTNKASNYFNFILKFNENNINSNLNYLYENLMITIIIDFLEENQYSSLGARATAMDNSTSNATTIINEISLMYNKARQAAITNELIEIVSVVNII